MRGFHDAVFEPFIFSGEHRLRHPVAGAIQIVADALEMFFQPQLRRPAEICHQAKGFLWIFFRAFVQQRLEPVMDIWQRGNGA